MEDQKKERKNTLLTIRVTNDEMNALKYLSDSLGKTKSDSIIRACKFFLNAGEVFDPEEDKKEKKPHRIHLRVTSSDVEFMNKKGGEMGMSTSQIIREAIKSFARNVRNPY